MGVIHILEVLHVDLNQACAGGYADFAMWTIAAHWHTRLVDYNNNNVTGQ